MKLTVIVSIICSGLWSVYSYDLTILHTNDVHARIDEAYKYGGTCSAEQSAAGKCVGGSSRLYTKIKEVRQEGGNVLVLDGGDQFQGTFWFYVYKGLAIAQFMRKLGYDAMAIGNHEFDNGVNSLQDFINNVTATGGFDVLSANIDNSQEPRLTGYDAYIVETLGSKKVGIVGYTTTDTPSLTAVGSTGNLVFKDVVQSIKDSVQTMKAADPDIDIIIALGHAGFEIDKLVAKEVDDVDIVVGGHSNTFLYTGDELPASEDPAGDYPHRVTKNNGKTALCVQAYTFSKYLGNMSVSFDDNGDITSWQGNPILLDHSVPKDPEIEAMMAPYKAVVIAEGDKPIARAVVRLNAACRAAECNMGNFVGDSWIHSNLVYGSDIKWSRASIALLNGGSIRAPIEKGNITYAQLLTTMPFGNDVVTVTITGQTLLDVFEHSIGAFDGDASTGRFLQMSGAQVRYDLCKDNGNRVVELKVRCLNCDIPTFENVNPMSNYTILTTSFIAGGGDGYSMLSTHRLDYENLGIPDVNMVEEYMATLSTVYPAEDGRLVVSPAGGDKTQCSTGTELRSNTLIVVLLGAILKWAF